LQYVIPALLGFAGGIFGAWTQWGIEQRRQRLNQRRIFVSEWRGVLVPAFSEAEGEWDSKRRKILTSVSYSSIRPHLSKDAKENFEAERTMFVGEAALTKMLNDEIGRIESKWKLV
jgi:hypothetical protein